jgi:hypothetical protein
MAASLAWSGLRGPSPAEAQPPPADRQRFMARAIEMRRLVPPMSDVRNYHGEAITDAGAPRYPRC